VYIKKKKDNTNTTIQTKLKKHNKQQKKKYYTYWIYTYKNESDLGKDKTTLVQRV